jgi:hypothetical protein
MANYAIVKNNIIENVIIADTKEIALEVTDAEEVIETTGQPWIGWTRVDGEWIDPIEKI